MEYCTLTSLLGTSSTGLNFICAINSSHPGCLTEVLNVTFTAIKDAEDNDDRDGNIALTRKKMTGLSWRMGRP
jgi:hypothetical protein